jgi:16S rRNA (cytidine1402-2'-O)-methyltransferase
MAGTLFLVATPIGNLEDISARALRILKEAALIAAEDTRRTAGLLAHFAITTPTISFHEHNERDRTAQLIDRLRAGDSIAVVTDAGTPVISDPGATLVQTARAEGISIEAIPGPSAILTALVASGLPAESFTFLGFAPSKAGQRRAWLQALSAEPRTTIFFEAPHRIVETLQDMAALLADRRIVVARELTKRHEEILVGTPEELANRLNPPRGEFTIVVGPPAAAPSDAHVEVSDDVLWADYCALTAQPGIGRRDAVTTLARRYGRSARDIYGALERTKAAASASD